MFYQECEGPGESLKVQMVGLLEGLYPYVAEVILVLQHYFVDYEAITVIHVTQP